MSLTKPGIVLLLPKPAYKSWPAFSNQ